MSFSFWLTAWESCEPAVLHYSRSTIEGDPIRTVLYVVPGSPCTVKRFFDTSEDAFAADPGVVELTCTALEAAETCPWLVESGCTPD